MTSGIGRRQFVSIVGGAAATWPLVAHAQQPARARRIGVLMSTAETDPLETASLAAFTEELAKLGWTPGQNVTIDVRWGAADAKRMTANARELVSLEPDVLLAKGATNPAARQATSTIPIVFVVLPEAAALAYVGDFRKPNSNSTGFTTYERDLVGKRLGLLRDLAPLTKRIMYVRSRQTGVDTQALFDRLSAEADTVGLLVTDAPAENAADIEAAFAAFAKEPDGGLIVAFDAFTYVHRQELVELAAQSLAGDLSDIQFWPRRRSVQLRLQSRRTVSPRGILCRSHIERGETGGPSRADANQVRTRAEPEDRKIAGAQRATRHGGYCGRGD
jgi:putative tryptophan/tyrosine transport system substrate-binding protein